jgi:hypothetical protein
VLQETGLVPPLIYSTISYKQLTRPKKSLLSQAFACIAMVDKAFALHFGNVAQYPFISLAPGFAFP